MSGLGSYFEHVALKRLSAVEASRQASNQHEINGVAKLISLFGDSGRREIEAVHFDLDDLSQGPTHVARLTWYDARERHLTRSERRLYFVDELSPFLHENGIVVFAKRGDAFYCFTAMPGGVGERLAEALFQSVGEPKFVVRDESALDEEFISASAQLLLAEVGVAPRTAPDVAELARAEFGTTFPSGERLSEFVRSITHGVDALKDPDTAFIAWLRTELEVFTALEEVVSTPEMDSAETLDDKLAVAMRVFQRRRSRAGRALESHLMAVFEAHGVDYSHTPETENGERPDFVFPSIEAYRDPTFPAEELTVLGSKQTLRDRWRQVLSEADRVHVKHLFTVDPGISGNQAAAIAAAGIQLVMPREVRASYPDAIALTALDLDGFLALRRRVLDSG